jgi:hypothetical protein
MKARKKVSELDQLIALENAGIEYICTGYQGNHHAPKEGNPSGYCSRCEYDADM